MVLVVASVEAKGTLNESVPDLKLAVPKHYLLLVVNHALLCVPENLPRGKRHQQTQLVAEHPWTKT